MSGVSRRRGEWPDLRLAGLALGCWLAALAGVRTTAAVGATVTAVAAAMAAATASVAARCGRARSRVAERCCWVAVTVLLGVVAGAAATAARVAERDAGPLAGLADRRAMVRVSLVVGDDPRPVRASRRPETVAIPGRLVWIEADGVADTGGAATPVRFRTGARVLVLASGAAWTRLLPGQRVQTSGRLAPSRGGDLQAAVLSAGSEHPVATPAPWLQQAAGGLRGGLRRACAPLPPEPGGLLPGLVVGDTTHLDPALAEEFRATGMTHLVAVSGSNCAIIVGAVLLIARLCRAGPRLSAVLCALALTGFVILARPSPSVLRAAAMGGLALVALASGRPRAAVPALATVVAVLVVVDPGLAGDAGFALSVLATAGLLLLAPGWVAALRRHRVPAGVAEALAVALAAQVACAPVVAALSATVSLTAVPANLLAAPAVAPATILGVVAALLSVPWPQGGQYAAWLGSWPARWLVWLAHAGAGTSSSAVPWPSGTGGGLLLAVLLLLVLVAWRIGLLRRLALVTALAATVGAVPVRLAVAGWPPPGWFVAACDVGQGDAVVLPAGPRQAVVVDTGPQPAPVDACLRSLGIDRVALLLISHFHADHVGGVEGVLRGRPATAVVVPEYQEPAGGAAAVRDAARRIGAPVHVARAGEEYVAGAVRLSVLGPVRPLRGTRSDPNNNSLVVLATVGGRTVLLAGDAEAEEQRSVCSSPAVDDLRVDVLKVAHHGSSYQDVGFVARAAPAVALVSVGQGNGFGHPDLAVLSRLGEDGARVLRTDLDGTVAVAADHGQLAVAAHRGWPERHRR